MEKTKFIEFLKVIQGKFRRDLQDFIFVTSNQLSKREEVIFLGILKRLGKTREVDETEIVNTFLKDEEKKNWNRMKNHFVKVLKRYLVMNSAQEDKSMSNLLLLNYFHKNNMEKNLSSDLRKAFQAYGIDYNLDEQSSLQRYRLYEFEVQRGKNNRKADENLDLMAKNLDHFYLENRLRCLCEQVNRKYVINTDYDSENFITFVEKEIQNIDSPGVNIYYNLYKMLIAEKKETYFEKVNQWIEANLDLFSKKYVKEIYDRLMNFCIRKINDGETAYASMYLKYVDTLISKKLFLESRKLSALRYKNCITIGLVANNKAWAKDFLETHFDHLEIANREHAYKFNKAHIQFYNEAYEECQKLLVGFQPFDMYYKIAYDKLILMLSYYLLLEEKYDVMNLRKKMASLKRYVQTQKKLRREKKSKVIFFLTALSELIKGKAVDVDSLLGKISILDYLWLKGIYKKRSD